MKKIVLAKIKDLVEKFYDDMRADPRIGLDDLRYVLSEEKIREEIGTYFLGQLENLNTDSPSKTDYFREQYHNSPDRKDTIREEFAQEIKKLEERILKQLNAKETKTPSPELISRFKVLFARENEIREEYEEKRRALEEMVQPIRDHVAECELFWNNHFGEDATVVVFVFNDEGAKKGIKVHRPNLDRGRVIIGGSLPHGIEYEETILCLEDED